MILLEYLILQFEDPRDADDAIYGRDGYNFDGYRLRVSCTCVFPSANIFHYYGVYI